MLTATKINRAMLIIISSFLFIELFCWHLILFVVQLNVSQPACVLAALFSIGAGESQAKLGPNGSDVIVGGWDDWNAAGGTCI